MNHNLINSFIPNYPLFQNTDGQYNKDFYNTLYNLKEFRDLTLSENETVPYIQGDPLKHQIFIEP